MPAVQSALVVGAGAAGTAAAILLAEAGVAVDLVEVKPEPATVGSGITLQGNALRVLRRLGVWDEVRAAGYPFDGLGLRAPGPPCRPRWGCRARSWPGSCWSGPPRSGRRSASAPRSRRWTRTPTASTSR